MRLISTVVLMLGMTLEMMPGKVRVLMPAMALTSVWVIVMVGARVNYNEDVAVGDYGASDYDYSSTLLIQAG